jgi:hypothetical protein
MCCIALFTLTALPPVYLRLLPFHDFLTARQKQFLYTSYALTYILETIALWITSLMETSFPIHGRRTDN